MGVVLEIWGYLGPGGLACTRLGATACIQALADDAAASKGKLGHEPRTGARASQDENGSSVEVVGGRDGVDLGNIKPTGLGGLLKETR